MAGLSKIHSDLGKRIKLLRKEHNLTQEDLAELLDVDRSYMGFIERGERNITLARIARIASVFKLSISELFNTEHK